MFVRYPEEVCEALSQILPVINVDSIAIKASLLLREEVGIELTRILQQYILSDKEVMISIYKRVNLMDRSENTAELIKLKISDLIFDIKEVNNLNLPKVSIQNLKFVVKSS